MSDGNVDKLTYCKNCLGKHKIIDYFYSISLQQNVKINRDIMNNGFQDAPKASECAECHSPVIKMNLTINEWKILKTFSTEQDFIFAMDKLKTDDIMEFALKMAQFKQSCPEVVQKPTTQIPNNQPKCPTCGSTNIKRISGVERAGSVGFFGLFSKKINKSFQCNNCKYTW